MKVGDKVFCKDDHREYTGWIASIDDSSPYPYSIVKNRKDIGKSFGELDNLYRDDSGFDVFELESLTLLEDDKCQYCNLTKRELKMVQSELNDAYVMLQNRDKKIKELEREEPKLFELIYPEQMYHVKRVLAYSDRDDKFYDKDPAKRTKAKSSFTQEEIDSIPFDISMFTVSELV